MERVHDPQRMRHRVGTSRSGGRRVGFVPTMGALHAGHESLVRRGLEECDDVAVSIFVNPTQFGPSEDFAKYPRPFEDDCARLERLGVRWLFAPDSTTMYPSGEATRIRVGGPAEGFEAAFRPGHFDGVATVVAKLFHAVPADFAYFGEKDWQQSVVVRRMVADLLLPVEVVVCPTRREPDGLAMSSRNAYLDPSERALAPMIHGSLQRACEAWARGEGVVEIERDCRAWLSGLGFDVDYWSVVDEDSLRPLAGISEPPAGMPRILVACRLGRTRLIDTLRLPKR